ncbi:MAG: hypothetical protein Q9169_006114 [Polycauliona sp. 2 TL-2023]
MGSFANGANSASALSGTFRLVLVSTAGVKATSPSHDIDGGRRSVYEEELVVPWAEPPEDPVFACLCLSVPEGVL